MKRPARLIGATLAAAAATAGLAAPAHLAAARGDPVVPAAPPPTRGADATSPVPPVPYPAHNVTAARRPRPRRPRRRLSHRPPSAGAFRNLVLLVRFADHGDRSLPSRDDISRLYNAASRPVAPDAALVPDPSDDVVPTGSVRQVYLANSHGRFDVDTTVADWVDLAHGEAHCESRARCGVIQL